MNRNLSGIALVALLAFAAPPAQAGDVMCPPNRGPVTIGGNVVVVGDCTLGRTTVDGNVFVEDRGVLTANRANIRGNVQSDGGLRVRLLRTDVDGSVQLKNLRDPLQSMVERSRVKGSIQLDDNDSRVVVLDNVVDEDVQAFKNRGGVVIRTNTIGGNLQCKENVPAPTGFGNRVGGNKEDQCRNF